MSSLSSFQSPDANVEKHVADLEGRLRNIHLTEASRPHFYRAMAKRLCSGDALYLGERPTTQMRPFLDIDIDCADEEEAQFWSCDETADVIAKAYATVMKRVFPQKKWGTQKAMFGIFRTKNRYVCEQGKYKASMHVRSFTKFSANGNEWTQEMYSSFAVNFREMLLIQKSLMCELTRQEYFANSGYAIPADFVDPAPILCKGGLRFPFCSKKPRKCKVCTDASRGVCASSCVSGTYTDPKIYILGPVYDFGGGKMPESFLKEEGIAHPETPDELSMIRTFLQFSIGIYPKDNISSHQIITDVQIQFLTHQGAFSNAYNVVANDFEIKEKIEVVYGGDDENRKFRGKVYSSCEYPPHSACKMRPISRAVRRLPRRKGNFVVCLQEHAREIFPILAKFIMEKFPRYAESDKHGKRSPGIWITSIRRPLMENEEKERAQKINKGYSEEVVARDYDKTYCAKKSLVYIVNIDGPKATCCGNLKPGDQHGSSKSSFVIRCNQKTHGKILIHQTCFSRKPLDPNRHMSGSGCANYKSKEFIIQSRDHHILTLLRRLRGRPVFPPNSSNIKVGDVRKRKFNKGWRANEEMVKRKRLEMHRMSAIELQKVVDTMKPTHSGLMKEIMKGMNQDQRDAFMSKLTDSYQNKLRAILKPPKK